MDAIEAAEKAEKDALRQLHNDMARRACEEILSLKLVKTKTELAEKLEWNGPNLSAFLSGNRKMPDRQLSLLIRIFGDKILTKLPPDPHKNHGNNKPTVSDDDYYAVSIVEADNFDGLKIYRDSNEVKSHIKMAKSYLQVKCTSLTNIGFIVVTDDSMVPTISPRAYVLIDFGMTYPVHGKIFYLSYKDKKSFKRLEVRNGTITALVSDKDLSRIEINNDDEVQIYGQALLQNVEI